MGHRAAMLVALVMILPLVQPTAPAAQPRADDLGVYHTYDEMVSELENLTAANPGIMSLESIGRTYEDRDLWVVKLSDNVSVDEPEPNITILGGIHAGELISVEVALHILEFLVGNYSANSTVGWYVNSTQLWFMPMVNPDGHVFVEQGNNWRKNRRPTTAGNYGVDLNRNFGHLWGLEASSDPAEDNYCGPGPFSENETQAVARLVTDHHPEITISYHSYASYILYPWGNSIDKEPVDPRLPEIAWNMSRAMPEGRRYAPMMALGMYPATGDSDDWFYANLSILPFTVEIGTSHRPLDSAVPGICADNLGPAMYVLNYTVGSPPPPPPERSLELSAPGAFTCLPLEDLRLNFTLENTGEVAENISVGLLSGPENWTVQLDPASVELAPGGSATVVLWAPVPEKLPAGEAVTFVLRATSSSGLNATARAEGAVGLDRELDVEVRDPSVMRPGMEVNIPVTVINDGNAFDSVSVVTGTDVGWTVSQIPSPFELGPWTSTSTFVKLSIPEPLGEGVTWVNLTFDISNLEGTFHRDRTHPFSIHTTVRLDWSVGLSDIELAEGEKLEVPVTLTNHGSIHERGRVHIEGDRGLAWLDRTDIDLEPGESATVVMTLGGKAGTWKTEVVFVSDGGYPDRRVGVDFTIRARPETPPDYTATLAAFAIIMVAAAAAVLLARRRGRKRDSGGKDAR